MPLFSGRVHSVIYDNAAQGFYILRMVLDGEAAKGSAREMSFEEGGFSSTVTVRGTVAGLRVEVGTWFGFEGEWVHHEQYGKQLAIHKAPVIEKWDTEVVASVLSANGVGDRVVFSLKDHFGEELPETLDKLDASLLEAVPGITQVIALHVIARWKVAKAYFRTLEFLADVGVPRQRVSQVWTVFGEEAEEVLSTNPWALVRIDGITFPQADAVAAKLDLDMKSPLRVEGAIRYVMKTRKGMGHLYLTSGEIVGEVGILVGEADPSVIAQGIARLHKTGGLVVDKSTRPGTTAIYEPWLFMVEDKSATLLHKRVEDARLEHHPDKRDLYLTALSRTGPEAEAAFAADPTDLSSIAHAALLDWSNGSKVSLSDKQMEGAVNALTKPVAIVTGLPGTGKTTLLRAVVQLLRDAEVSFLLIAPTGIAAKRIASVTGAPAATIHRAFEAQGFMSGKSERAATYAGITGSSGALDGSDGSGDLWGCSDSPYPADVIICDETSMVDQHLLYRILTCTRPNARLVFIGDAAQLPSVGPGNVLRDMISTERIPTIALRDIFRQADTSQIVVAAHAINAGEVPETSRNIKDDFVLIPTDTEEQTLDTVIKFAAALFKKRSNFQVMSPRHAGVIGVTNLNSRLRELLNPRQPGLAEMRMGSEVIREDDRVMVVKNNYELEIFNGDTGKVSRLDRKAKHSEIKLHGPPVQYVHIPFKDGAEYLRLAYAVTVHKMQGQEADNVVIPIMTSFGHQLQRNLLYTAITRAKKRVILVGQHEALVRAIENNRPDERNTLFSDRLERVFTQPRKDA